MKRILILLLCMLCASPLLFCQAAAESDEESLLDSLFDALPDAVREETKEESAQSDAFSADYYIRFLADSILSEKGRFLSVLSGLFGFLVLLAAASGLSVRGGHEVRLLLSLSLVLYLYTVSEGIFRTAAAYITDIAHFGELLLPILGGLYAAGGNSAAAVSEGASFAVFLTALEIISSSLLLPLVQILFSFSAVSLLQTGGAPDISAVGNTVRHWYMTILLFLSLLFGIFLSGQSLLSSAADTAAQKTLRFAAQNMIPLVGSTVSGALGTISASVSYLRGTVGGIASAAVLLLTLPVLIELLLYRFAISLCEMAAGILSQTEVKRALSQFIGIYDALIASVALSSVGFLFSVTLFAKCAAAL